MKSSLKKIFLNKEGYLYGEPLIVILAFFIDLFFGKTNFTMWFGWWLFLIVAINLPRHIYTVIKIGALGRDRFSKEFPELMEWITTHRTFAFIIYYSFFLYFWWKWL